MNNHFIRLSFLPLSTSRLSRVTWPGTPQSGRERCPVQSGGRWLRQLFGFDIYLRVPSILNFTNINRDFMNIARWSVTCSNMSQRHTSVWGKWNLRWEKASFKLNRPKTRPIFASASAMNAATKKVKVKQERSDLGYRTPSGVVPSSPTVCTASLKNCQKNWQNVSFAGSQGFENFHQGHSISGKLLQSHVPFAMNSKYSTRSGSFHHFSHSSV